MADNTGAPPPNQNENVNVYGDNIYVRYKEGSVPKPASKSSEDASLKDISKPLEKIGEKPEWLDKAIKDVAQEIAKHLNNSGGGGGGDGKSPGAASEDARFSTAAKTRQQSEVFAGQAVKDLTEATKKLKTEFHNSIKVLTNLNDFRYKVLELTIMQVTETLSSFRQEMIGFIADLASGRYAMERFKEMWEGAFEAASIGIGSFADMLKNAAAFGPSYLDTLEAIKNNVERGGNAFGYAGTSVSEFGKALSLQRDRLEGLIPDIDAQLDYKEQNAILLDIYNSMIRSGIKADIDDARVAQMAAWQLEYLKTISMATGKSLKELIKMNEVPVSIEDAIALGMSNGGLTQEEAMKAKATYDAMMAMGDKTGADALAKYIQNLATGGVTGSNPNDFADNTFFATQQLMETIRKKGSTPEEINAAMIRSGRMRLQTQQSYGGMAQVTGSPLEGAGRPSDANKLLKSMEAVERNTARMANGAEKPNTWFERMYNSFQEWLSNNAWIKDLAAIASGISGLAIMGVALWKNTVATFANTGALGALTAAMTGGAGVVGAVGKGGGIMGLVGGVFKLASGLLILQTVVEGFTNLMNPATQQRWGAGLRGFVANFFSSFGPLVLGGVAALAASVFGAPASIAMVVGAAGIMLYRVVDEWTGGALTDFFGWFGQKLYDVFGGLFGWIGDFVDNTLKSIFGVDTAWVGEKAQGLWDSFMDSLWRDDPISQADLNKAKQFLAVTSDNINPGGMTDAQLLEELKRGNENSHKLLAQLKQIMADINAKTTPKPIQYRSA